MFKNIILTNICFLLNKLFKGLFFVINLNVLSLLYCNINTGYFSLGDVKSLYEKTPTNLFKEILISFTFMVSVNIRSFLILY